MTRHLPSLILLLALASSAPAAPPACTALFPAGGQRGQTVEVAATGSFERWPAQVWCDRKDVEVSASKEKGKFTVKIAADAVPGVRWLRFYDDQGATAQRPFIVGVLPEVAEKEPNDDFKKPHTLPGTAVTVNGRLEKAGDVDCFAVTLKQGQTLVASLEANQTLGSPMDGIVQVLSADGFVLQENNDYRGLDPQLVFAAPRDGAYVVRVFAFPAMPDSSVRFAGGEGYIYRLTLTTGAFADHAWPAAVAKADAAEVELVGWNIPDAAKKRSIEREVGIAFHPEAAGVATVRREPHAVVIAAETNDRQHPQTISLPVTVSGRLLQRDAVQAFQFDATKGQKLSFQAEARALGFPTEPALRLLDASGKVVAQAESTAAREAELAFTAPQDGTYRLEVRDLHASGSPRHAYLLRAVRAVPEFDLTLTTDRFVVNPGKPLDIPLTITRRHGFERAIELSVEGLPPGVTATTVQAGAAANAKTVTLQLKAEAMPANVPIRIQGKTAGQDEPTTARAASDGRTTAHIWLTVAPKP